MDPTRWFRPDRLFEGGYPAGISSALRSLAAVRAAVLDEVARAAPRRALEVGPGDAPLLADVAGAVYLDVVARFLAAVRGPRVLGDVRRAPFRDATFDLVVASDVFTHIPPDERAGAVGELVRVARRVLIFNPEPGTLGVPGSPVPSDDLEAALGALGLAVRRRDFAARVEEREGGPPGGRYTMSILVAERPTSA